MKLRLVLTVAGVLLCVTTGMAVAAEVPQGGQTASKATMQDNANASAQATTDMSYGGTTDNLSASGMTHMRQCKSGPQCDIYFGN